MPSDVLDVRAVTVSRRDYCDPLSVPDEQYSTRYVWNSIYKWKKMIIFISPIKRQQTTYTQIKADRTQTQT